MYLYLLRHEGDNIKIPDIADALNHRGGCPPRSGILGADRCPCTGRESVEEQETAVTREMAEETENSGARFAENRQNAGSAPGRRNERTEIRAEVPMDEGIPGCAVHGKPAIPDAGNSYDRMKRLSSDENSPRFSTRFSSISERHSARSNVKFAYFYDVLHMSCELLEYLAEYCAEGGHEHSLHRKVALKWYEEGIHTKDEAREYSIRYSKDMSAVKKAFGIMGRIPGTAEQEFMRRWFKEFGFDSAIVTEACNRTLTATGPASFRMRIKSHGLERKRREDLTGRRSPG